MDAASDKTFGAGRVRQRHAREQLAGLVACLAGVLALVWGRFGAGAPAAAMVVGLASIGLGWALFAYVIVMRTRHVRAQLQNCDS